MKLRALAVWAGLLALTACTPPPDPEVGALKAKIRQLEEELKTQKLRVQAADHDHGLKDYLTEEQELLRSRLERLRLRLRELQPDAPEARSPEAAPAAAHDN